MNAKWIIIGGTVLVIVAWLFYSASQDQQLTEQASRLAQRHAITATDPSVGDTSQAVPILDLDSPARKQIGMPVPKDLVVARVDDEYWFVGKYKHGPGVEIPFAPGKLTTPAAKLEPVHENPGFVGAEACKSCHAELYSSSLDTMHYNTSCRVDESTIKGRFDEQQNILTTCDSDVKFEMLQRDNQYFQRVHFFDWKFDVPMEISVGAAIIGQSYLYWHGDQLYQANVTHLNDGDRWINSPGYVDGDAAYARPIRKRCLNCHGTYYDFRAEPNHYTPDSLILGVTCERCHGPGEQHVRYHQQHPQDTKAQAIRVISDLPREKQLEVCGQCHLTNGNIIGHAFRFRPGDNLHEFYDLPTDSNDVANQVHGSNQLARLKKSRCFQGISLGCTDCHDPHRNQRGKTRVHSQRCAGCHEVDACGMHDKVDFELAENCIDCHMPNRPIDSFFMRSVEGDAFPPLRDHFIRVDQQATDEFLEQRSGQRSASQ